MPVPPSANATIALNAATGRRMRAAGQAPASPENTKCGCMMCYPDCQREVMHGKPRCFECSQDRHRHG